MNRHFSAALAELYKERFGYCPENVTELPAGGSHRIYYRLSGRGLQPAVGVAGTDVAENRAFIYLAERLKAASVCVPELYAVSDDSLFYLQEDLGDVQLFGELNKPDGRNWVAEAVSELPRLQTAPGIDWTKPFLQKSFCLRQALWDLNYFKYCFLKGAGEEFDEDRLEDDFLRFAGVLTEYPDSLSGLMYRDCQSRNVMIHNGRCYWIDFQGARPGCVLYDLASFLWQAKARFSPEFRREMTNLYLAELGRLREFDTQEARRLLGGFVFFRTLQVLGAYGFRGLTEHKAHFITSIPAALSNLAALLDRGAARDYPELERCCRALCSGRYAMEPEASDALCVEVISFSFKKGYPEDLSGNGGGFMFDCRALHNPGRYDEYKPLTGRDEPVIRFLEERGETQPFLRHAWELTDPAVERYLSRGFTHLQIGFGCTGGRHRSVYSAERTAAHLREKFGGKVAVRLVHREHGIEEFFPAD